MRRVALEREALDAEPQMFCPVSPQFSASRGHTEGLICVRKVEAKTRKP